METVIEIFFLNLHNISQSVRQMFMWCVRDFVRNIAQQTYRSVSISNWRRGESMWRKAGNKEMIEVPIISYMVCMQCNISWFHIFERWSSSFFSQFSDIRINWFNHMSHNYFLSEHKPRWDHTRVIFQKKEREKDGALPFITNDSINSAVI